MSSNSSSSPLGDQKLPLRPSLTHNAVTVIPTVGNPDKGAHRARAGTSPERSRSSVGIIHRRRADTSASPNKSQLPHLVIKLPQGFEYKDLQRQPENNILSAQLLQTHTDRPTAPIAIPQRKDRLDRPSTPLSGRPHEFTRSDLIALQALKEKYSSRDSETSSDKSTSPTQTRLSGPSTMGSRHSPQRPYRPSSPLSPTRSVFIPSNEPRRTPRQLQKSLNLAGLPKFHPANFTHVDSSAPVPPRSTRGRASQPRANRHGSDAQQKLQQYQRDVVASFARLSHSSLSQGATSEPKSPRLAPRGSPGDPMTPLVLESGNDYLTAGTRSPGESAAAGREIVERLVQKENERRQHPEAHSGSLSPTVSPGISPTISPAGG